MNVNSLEANTTLKVVQQILRTLALYHRHEVLGLEFFPQQGPVIMAVNHSLATYDGFLIGLRLFEKLGRLPKGLGDDLLFKIPLVKDWCRELGLLPASPHNARKLLAAGEVLGVAPGGMRESLRHRDQRFHILWKNRKGFVKLAQESGAPIVLAACPRADLIYHVYPSVLTKLAYKHFHVPLPIVRGWGFSLLPRPLKLEHVLSRPLYVSKNEPLEKAHAEICQIMQEMLTSSRPGLARQDKV